MKQRPGSDEASALKAILGSDDDTLAQLRDALRARLIRDEAEDGALALFAQFLRRLEGTTDPGSVGDEDFFDEVVAALSQLAIDENGGDPRARDLRRVIYDRLTYALRLQNFDAAALVLVAKILSDSGWRVPEELKRQVVENLHSPEIGDSADLETTLLEIASAAEGDAFAAYDALDSVLSAFPADSAAQMVATLARRRAPVLLDTLAGFVMHRDPVLAKAAVLELRQTANEGTVESALVERLVRMRPWLPAERQGPLDETIRALRARALPPVHKAPVKTARGFVMACDGSGAGGALASLRASDGWRFAAGMTKPHGVDEVLSLEGLSKAQVEAAIGGMRENVLAAHTDMAGVASYLQLALGENVTSGTPPPFRLIAFVETLAVGPLPPRVISGADLAADILADLPVSEKNTVAVKRAHQAVISGALKVPWFEAGESVERMLAPLAAGSRAKALLNGYLPERRAFWTRVCALSAFALRLEPDRFGTLAASLALVAREIASGAPLEKIPLMRQIAQFSVRAFAARA